MTTIEMISLKDNIDERGNLKEIYRTDWFNQDVPAVQAILTTSKEGTIRAWHRHNKGQLDYFFVLHGSIKLAVCDNITNQVETKIVNDKDLVLCRVDGSQWHGYKALEDCTIIYFVTRLYDYSNPDEERKPFDDKEINYQW